MYLLSFVKAGVTDTASCYGFVMQVREIVDLTSSRDRTPHEQRLSRREPLSTSVYGADNTPLTDVPQIKPE